MATAQERTWIKYHETIEMDETFFGEYTYISTSDELSPEITRFLYQDSQGTRLVIRYEFNVIMDENGNPVALDSSEISVAHLDTGEQFVQTFHGDGEFAAAVGGGSIDFTDAVPLRELFFHDAGGPFLDCTSDSTELVKPFISGIAVPTPFEEPFADAFYE